MKRLNNPIKFNNEPPIKERKEVNKALVRVKQQAIGRIGLFRGTWENHTQDPEILDTVDGKGIQLLETPFQDRIPHIRVQDKETLKREIEKLREQGVVEYASHSEGEYISRVFLVKKKDKKEHRLILDLAQLNDEFIEYKKFKMETLKSILTLVTPGCWFYSIDFSDAYYSIPVHESLR